MFRPLLRSSSGYDCESRLHSKYDGTRAVTRFRLSAKRTSPFKLAGASVQSTTGSRGVRISGSNARYTMLQGSVKSTGYPLLSPVSTSLPLPCVTKNRTECSLAQHRFPISFVSLSIYLDYYLVLCTLWHFSESASPQLLGQSCLVSWLPVFRYRTVVLVWLRLCKISFGGLYGVSLGVF